MEVREGLVGERGIDESWEVRESGVNCDQHTCMKLWKNKFNFKSFISFLYRTSKEITITNVYKVEILKINIQMSLASL